MDVMWFNILSHSVGSELLGCCLDTDVYILICIFVHTKNRSAIFYKNLNVICSCGLCVLLLSPVIHVQLFACTASANVTETLHLLRVKLIFIIHKIISS
jgi:hypothetical protein